MIIFSRAESLIRKREHSAVAVGFMRWTEPETDWKKANVTPIFMKGKEEAAGDCRLVRLSAAPFPTQEGYGTNPPGSHIQHVTEKKVMPHWAYQE